MLTSRLHNQSGTPILQATSPQIVKCLEVFEDRIEWLVAPMTMMRDPVMVS